jgi:hypothetical protein
MESICIHLNKDAIEAELYKNLGEEERRILEQRKALRKGTIEIEAPMVTKHLYTITKRHYSALVLLFVIFFSLVPSSYS